MLMLANERCRVVRIRQTVASDTGVDIRCSVSSNPTKHYYLCDTCSLGHSDDQSMRCPSLSPVHLSFPFFPFSCCKRRELDCDGSGQSVSKWQVWKRQMCDAISHCHPVTSDDALPSFRLASSRPAGTLERA